MVSAIHTASVVVASKTKSVSGAISVIVGLLLVVFCKRYGHAQVVGQRAVGGLWGKKVLESRFYEIFSVVIVFVIGVAFVGVGVAELVGWM